MTYEAQSQLRLGLCGILSARLALKPCFKDSKDGKQKFIYLDPMQKIMLKQWCDAHVRLKYVQAAEDTRKLGEDERLIIQRHRPLLNTDHSIHPFSVELRELKALFLRTGESRPYPST